MLSEKTTPQTIDEYISGYPANVQEMLQKIRMTIHETAPDAKETIKYKMPTFTLNGNLISFAVNKTHIGIYPAPVGSVEFNRRLKPYRAEKSTIRFPLDKPIPFDLLHQIVNYLVDDNIRRSELKSKKLIK